MANLNIVIVPAKVLKNGKHNIRISVSHNGETRYILTNIIIDSLKEFKNGQVVKRPDANIKNTKLRELMNKYQNIIDELDYIEGLTCPELVQLIKNKKTVKYISIENVFEEYMNIKIAKKSSIEIYRYEFQSLKKYIDKDIYIKDLTSNQILLIKKEMSKKMSDTTILNILSLLKSLCNYAKNNNYIKESPFIKVKLPSTEIRDSWLTVEEIIKIRDIDLSNQNSRCRLCRDLFMLSYYLGGINMCDLAKINFIEQNNTIKYIRQKTEKRKKLNKYVEFNIPKEAKDIITRLIDKNGYIKFTKSELKNRFTFIFRHFKTIQKMTGIKKIMYYSARKSFSQHAFCLGISTSIIDYILGHKINYNNKSLYHYVLVTPEMATDAIRKVLDNLK